MPELTKLRLRGLWLAIGYLLVAFVVFQSLSTSPIEGPEFPLQDKVFHALAYCVLMGWFAQIYQQAGQRVRTAASLIALGILMDVLQSFEPERYAEFADFLANTLGVILAWWLTRNKLKNILLMLEARLLG